MGISQQILDDFSGNGFLKLDQIIPLTQINTFLSSYKKCLRFVSEQLKLPRDVSDDYLLNKRISEIYDANLNAGALIYDTFNRHHDFHNFFVNSHINRMISTILDCETTEDLVITNHQFFIHPPKIERNLLGWHQDSSYFQDFISLEKSIVFWFPLQKLEKEDGALWFIPKSHKKGMIEHHTNEFGSHKEQELNKRGLVYLDSSYIEEKKAIQVSLNVGDALIIDKNIIHKSGQTNGERARYTALARFSNIYGKDYISKYKMW